MKKPIVNKIKRQSVASQVYEQLKHNIVSGIWTAGEKIPSENQLVKMLGVSRISVREALKQLVSLGLLEARQGEGTFVKQLEADSYIFDTPETIDIEKPGKYNIDIKGLLEEEPIIIQKDGSYTIHLPSIFEMVGKERKEKK